MSDLLGEVRRRRAATTARFVAAILSDYELQSAVYEHLGELLRSVPNVTDQTLGRSVKDRVFAWAHGGGWGYGNDRQRFKGALDGLYVHDYGEIDEIEVGETLRDALGIERG